MAQRVWSAEELAAIARAANYQGASLVHTGLMQFAPTNGVFHTQPKQALGSFFAPTEDRQSKRAKTDKDAVVVVDDSDDEEEVGERKKKSSKKGKQRPEKKARSKKDKSKAAAALFLEQEDDVPVLLPIAAPRASAPPPSANEDRPMTAEKKALTLVERIGPAPLPKPGRSRTLDSLEQRIKWYESGNYFAEQPKEFHQTLLTDGSSVVPRAATKGISHEWRNRAALFDYARCTYEKGLLQVEEGEYALATGTLKTATFYAARSRGWFGRDLMQRSLLALLNKVPKQWSTSGKFIDRWRVDVGDVQWVLQNLSDQYYEHNPARASLLQAVLPMARAYNTSASVAVQLGICCELHQDFPCVLAEKPCKHLRP